MDFSQPDPKTVQRIEDLLQQMTLDEKVGQLVQADVYWKQDVPQMVRDGRVGSMLSIRDPRTINVYQRIAVEESRLGIPLLFGNDVLHGYRTIFPIPLAMACTWNPGLVADVAAAISIEAAAAGTTWNFSPMVDLCRDPRWGRVAEGAGEDPYLGSAMAAAWVRGFQAGDLPGGRGMAACVKHFGGYGGAEAGRDYNTVDMSERRLRDDYLPPYRAALEAGAATLMTAFNELNGIPATADPFLLQDVLRREWGFQGVVISDYDAIGELIFHGLVADHHQATLCSAQAGVDVDMMGDAYPFHLAALVREGLVDEAWITAAARRVLALKFRLGVFTAPYIEEGLTNKVFLRPEALELGRQAAVQAAVLLKNEGNLLPLAAEGRRIALIGPLADDRSALLGSWSCEGRAEDTPTLLESLRQALPAEGQVHFAPGCEIDGPQADIPAACEAARAADVVVLALGESEGMSGEAHSRAHLGLPGRQQELLEAVAATGRPLVVVLVCGRPLAIPWMEQHAGAILLAWQGGTSSGPALADVLLGHAAPGGRLCISLPRCEGQIPIYYARKNTGRPADLGGVTQFNQSHKSVYL
ncbi:MAG: hypothetical protein GYA17_16420, partial [Chloroflexi bacterium]|nr:hypothetical protein [Chloroflexota bacterium]